METPQVFHEQENNHFRYVALLKRTLVPHGFECHKQFLKVLIKWGTSERKYIHQRLMRVSSWVHDLSFNELAPSHLKQTTYLLCCLRTTHHDVSLVCWTRVAVSYKISSNRESFFRVFSRGSFLCKKKCCFSGFF